MICKYILTYLFHYLRKNRILQQLHTAIRINIYSKYNLVVGLNKIWDCNQAIPDFIIAVSQLVLQKYLSQFLAVRQLDYTFLLECIYSKWFEL